MLVKIINQINKEHEIKLRLSKKGKTIRIWDEYENYSINWLDEVNSNIRWACREFGFPYKPLEKDSIMEKLEMAVRNDYGEDAYIDWESSLVMVVTI